MKTEWNSLGSFMADNFQPFKPFAYFDKHMDCIRVKIMDCSVTEERLSRYFTILKPNHGMQARSGKSVGFTIKGIRHLFSELGIPMAGVVEVANLLDEIVKKYPHEAVKRVTEEFQSQVRKNDLKVSFEEKELHAA